MTSDLTLFITSTSSDNDEVNRRRLQSARGAVIRRQGELHGKDVWHVITYPYRPVKDEFTIVGNPPAGARVVRGPGSGYTSPTLAYGEPPDHTVTMEGGAVDPTLIPDRKRGITIRYVHDPTVSNKPRREPTIKNVPDIKVKERQTKLIDRNRRRVNRRSQTTDLGAGIVQSRGRRHLRL